MQKPTPTAPATLTVEGRKLWQAVLRDFAIDDAAARALLQAALEARDRMAQAQVAIREHGIVVRDRWGQLRSNPAVAAERDARQDLISALRALRLDIETPGPPGRPPVL